MSTPARLLTLASLVLVFMAACMPPITKHVDVSQPATPGPEPSSYPQPDSYVALAPSVLRAGHTENVSLSLLSGNAPAAGPVRLALLKDGQRVSESYSIVRGTSSVPLQVPRMARGDFELEVSGPGFTDRAKLRVEAGTLVFVETDKPIYKPGQTIHIRVITLDIDLKPWPAEVTVEVQDAKGTRVFKKDVSTDDYGMTSLDMPLSTEPNLGTWKVTARLGDRVAEVDVRVEEYVLPKYEVDVGTEKDWVLASEPIRGKVAAEYTFGKPVVGEVEIVASRYVGQWEEYARLTRDLDGQVEFELPPVSYVAGVPGARGMGNVTLEVTVREKATGYEEKSTHLLTVASTPISLQVIPESNAFKPGLPFSFLVVTETPDGQPVDAQVQLNLSYMDRDFDSLEQETVRVATEQGKAIARTTPPKDSVSLNLEATATSRVEGEESQAYATLALQAGYSPSGNFIHLEQVSGGTPRVGGTIRFHVHSTREASSFYYEVISRGRVIFSQVSRSPDIAITVTHLMAPSSRLLVYQVLPSSEVAADFLPFEVEADYPHQVEVAFSQEQVRPGDGVDIQLQTQGPARVGLVAVDRSVFILAENRLNLQQVFDELERLYQQPQVELHEASFFGPITTRGARETFQDAGLVVMTNKTVPEGEKLGDRRVLFMERALADAVAAPAAAPPMATPAPAPTMAAGQVPEGLAEVQRVRQFFPETWLWLDADTDADGTKTVPVEAPDSITTWMLRAVGISREHGLGVAEGQLRVFQPFFLQVDLPYSAIRGEEFPVRVALYNYLDSPQEIFVELEEADWFDLLDEPAQSVTVGASDIGGVEFRIRPRELGSRPLKVTARSHEAADAVIKDLLVEPEGVQREAVQNLVLAAGKSHQFDLGVPADIIEGSARAFIAVTGSYLTQTIEGLEGLLQMPFGCGEQNMVLFAPNVFIARYLKETNQLKPEVMARAELLMMTGYQRELTYRRADGSFSAFGDSDEEGSLWLTAFVLKTFAQARGLMFIDQAVLDDAADWITDHQLRDGSFEPVGFLHHQELLGGLQGKNALTAFVAVALMEDGETDAAERAVDYLEGQLDDIEDAYTMAIVAYALELADSPRADDAYEKLMGMAKESDEGLYWGDGPVILEPQRSGPPMPYDMQPGRSAAVETTGYATLALLEHGDRLNASRASRWLASQRNAFGGFGSTQDTVVGLQALTTYATSSRSDVDMTLTLEGDGWSKEVRVTPDNADVLQVIQAPVGGGVSVQAEGKGDVVLQAVLRYNLPRAREATQSIFDISVEYDTDSVEVDDLITLKVEVGFNPPEPMEAGMVVLDIAVPTGFAPVTGSIEAVLEDEAKVKRFDVAGRKVIFYIEDMGPGESLAFQFQARALYPVQARGVASQAYSYYRPEWRGETLGVPVTVAEQGKGN